MSPVSQVLRRYLLAEEARKEAEAARKEIANRTVTIITTALALVAALFWQTAITDTIKTFIPTAGAWQYEIVVAMAVTSFAAIAIYLLSRQVTKAQQPEKSGSQAPLKANGQAPVTQPGKKA